MVLGFQQITSLSAATALTVPAGARFCSIRAEAQNVRYRKDGTNPTAAIGEQLKAAADQPLTLSIESGMHQAKFIEEASAAKLNVHYYG
jgi:hypothetical protein